MKELVKPNQEESVYENAKAFCEVYNSDTRRYYTSYSAIGRVYADEDSDDILF